MRRTEPHTEGTGRVQSGPSGLYPPRDGCLEELDLGCGARARQRPAVIDRIFHDEASVRHLVNAFPNPAKLWSCYEAGPTGYDLHGLLTSLGVRCEVIAPSLVPKGRGDRIKTDKRDARRLAGLHHAGELVAIAVPGAAASQV